MSSRNSRKRTTKRTPKRTNSNIQTAQQAADAKLRQSVIDVEKAKEKATGGAGNTKLSARTGPMATRGAGIDQSKIAERDNTLGTSMSQSAQKVAGLASGLMDSAKQKAAQAQQQVIADNKARPNPLADASLYGANAQKRADRLTALLDDQNKVAIQGLTKTGQAVWMGYTHNRAKVRAGGPERLDPEGNNKSGGLGETTVTHYGDDVRSVDELMSWLTDEKTFNQIKTAATKAGIQVQSYDDVAKVWQDVVKKAAGAFSATGKRVTPWAILSLMGKSFVNGKPPAKTTVSTNIDEMDPAQAKLMIKQTLAQELGRDPKQAEIDDFISKAQQIARENPQVTTTTTQYDVLGNPTSQTSHSTGGADAVNAQAQLAAEEQAKNAPDYAQYQAAGVMMPWLNEALSSPF